MFTCYKYFHLAISLRHFNLLRINIFHMNNKGGGGVNFNFRTRKSSVTKVNIFLYSSQLNIVTPTRVHRRKRRYRTAQSRLVPRRLNTHQVSGNLP